MAISTITVVSAYIKTAHELQLQSFSKDLDWKKLQGRQRLTNFNVGHFDASLIKHYQWP
jgi:hypothetical protein